MHIYFVLAILALAKKICLFLIIYCHSLNLIQLYQNSLLLLVKAERKRFYFLLFFGTCISLGEILSLALLVAAIQFYTDPAFEKNLHFLPTWMVQKQTPVFILIVLFIIILKNGAAFFLHQARERYVYKVATRFSAENLKAFQKQSYQDFIDTDSSIQARKINQQPVEFAQYVLSGFQFMISEMMVMLFAVIAILWFNAILFFLLLTILFPAILMMGAITKKRLTAVKKNLKSSGELSWQKLREAITGYVEGNLYERNFFFRERYLLFQSRLNKLMAGFQVLQGMPVKIFEVAAVMGLTLIILFHYFMPSVAEAPGIIVVGAFLGAAYKIIPGIVRVINLSAQIKTYAFSIQKPGNDCENKKHIETFKIIKNVHIQFKDISFSYSSKNIFTNFNLEISGNTFLGISGKSGMGKSTYIYLLLGFLSPENGKILINGMKAGQQFFPCFSLVAQQPFLLHDTIAKNIILSDEDVDMKQLENILIITGISLMIQDFPDGIHHIISENGGNISGGQKQRICIARALYKNAPVIILDEPFNELDDESETLLLLHFRKMANDGKMIILITHNKNSLSYCDEIISFDNAQT